MNYLYFKNALIIILILIIFVLLLDYNSEIKFSKWIINLLMIIMAIISIISIYYTKLDNKCNSFVDNVNYPVLVPSDYVSHDDKKKSLEFWKNKLLNAQIQKLNIEDSNILAGKDRNTNTKDLMDSIVFFTNIIKAHEIDNKDITQSEKKSNSGVFTKFKKFGNEIFKKKSISSETINSNVYDNMPELYIYGNF